MIEPQTAPVSSTSFNQSAIARTQAGTIVEPGRFSLQTVGKTILRLQDPAILHQPTPAAVPWQAVEAMQQLVELVTRLRSPAGGCPPELEPTPISLSPYVREEIEEVLVALQGFSTSAPAHALLNTPYLPVEDLIPQLLWHVARSSYAVMQLIEGVPAQIKPAGQDWQTGMVRLVALLEAEVAESQWSFDLVTRRPLLDPLAPTTLLQFDWQTTAGILDATTLQAETEHVLVETDETVEQHLEHLQQIICTIASGIQPLTEGLKVDLLEPGKGWQSGLLRLRFNFEFASDWQAEIIDCSEESESHVSVAPQTNATQRTAPQTATVPSSTVNPSIPSVSISDDRSTTALTLEEFAAAVAKANGFPIPEQADDFLATNTLEEFAIDLTAPSYDRDTASSIVPESLQPQEGTLEEFAIQIAEVLGEAAVSQPHWVEAATTLEDFVVDVAQAIEPAPASTPEIPEPTVTLEDFFREVDASEPISPIEVLPIDSVASPATHSVWTELADRSQTIDIASVEILTASFDRQIETTDYFPASNLPTEELYPEAETTLTFRLVDTALQQTFSQATAQQHLTTRLLKYPEISSDQRDVWLIEQAWDSLQFLESATKTPAASETKLTEWMPYLLWQISRASYEMMRLIGGIEATVLQPHWGWKLGILRMLVMLQITTVGDTWEMDLATGQPVPTDFLPLDPRAIVRSDQLPQYQQPTLAEILAKEMIAQAQTATPEIKQWMAGCPVELRSSNGDWQPATLKLILSLEFDLGIQTINYR
ncbi:MAG: hypothetical protein KME16_06080 [Scytolyngbya sp. HA4215-MV1]|jgi:hypothetical protein|nr:hypothetical protein [Scytolyngbya sp. HA4215-MV1]